MHSQFISIIRDAVFRRKSAKVQFQLREANDVDWHPVNDISNALSIGIRKLHPRNRGQDLQPKWRVAHPDNVIGLQEQIRGDTSCTEAECSKDSHQLLSIVGMDGNPNIHIAGRTRIAVIADRIATDEQIVNLMIVQQLQELFEVGR